MLADLRLQVRHGLVAAGAKMVLAAVPFMVAYRWFATGDLSPGDFAASVVALAAALGTAR